MYLAYITNLENLPSPIPTNTEFIVGGYNVPGDGGGGTFIWIPVTVAPIPSNIDRGIVFLASNDPTGGHFARLFSGPINVRWFGAVGDSYSTDVTTEVSNAITSAFAYGGTVYFPKGVYAGHIVIDPTDNVSIIGDGQGTILTSVPIPLPPSPPCPATTIPTPVYDEVILIKRHWGFIVRISKVQIVGNFNSCPDYTRLYNGISFDPNDEQAGGTFFENITLVNLKYGVYKPTGNIKNTFINCIFSANKVGYYAQKNPSGFMHSGADEFVRGEFSGHSDAALYIEPTYPAGYGQLSIDSTIIEGNPGFGILANFSGSARMMGNAISLRNVWMEANGGTLSGTTWTPTGSVTIGGNNYYNVTDYQFLNVRTVAIYDSVVKGIVLEGSSVTLYNCFSDDSADYYYIVIVDTYSSLVATELNYRHNLSESIFVNSISYDGSAYLNTIDPNAKTSVWGPLRTAVATNNNQTGFSTKFYGTDAYSFTSIVSTQVPSGVLGNECAELTIPMGGTAQFDTGFRPTQGKYYLWSIHLFHVIGDFESELKLDGVFVFGQAIAKPNQWSCAYGIKQYTEAVTGNVELFLTNPGGWVPTTIRVADLQILEFDNYYDAAAFANSKAFAALQSNRYRVKAFAFFRWDPVTSSFTIENAYNIAAINYMGTGYYDIIFANTLSETPVPSLAFYDNTSANPWGVVGAFDLPLTTQITVYIWDFNTKLFVDNTFSLAVY